MEGFEGLCLIDTDECTQKEEKKVEETYIPISREPFGFLCTDQDLSNRAPQIQSNIAASKAFYHFAIRDYQTAINLSLEIVDNRSCEKSVQALLNQFYDIICRSYLELGIFEKAAEYTQLLTDSSGHNDSDSWMISAIINLLCGNVSAGFKALERVVMLRPGHPNVWLLYATVVSHFHRTSSESMTRICDSLSNCVIYARFHGKWNDVLSGQHCSKEVVHVHGENVLSYVVVSVNNALKLNNSFYHQHSSKKYPEFSTEWGSEVSDILRSIIFDYSEPNGSIDKCYNVIHYQNWDDFDCSTADFVQSFFGAIDGS